MPGSHFPIINMAEPTPNAVQLAKKLFGKSEAQNRMSLSTVKMILADIHTLYKEFKDAEGAGALFFHPSSPDQSQYMTIKDMQGDIALAEEIMDKALTEFLRKILTIIEKEDESDKPIVVMINEGGMSVHVLDLESADKMLDQTADAASSD